MLLVYFLPLKLTKGVPVVLLQKVIEDCLGCFGVCTQIVVNCLKLRQFYFTKYSFQRFIRLGVSWA